MNLEILVRWSQWALRVWDRLKTRTDTRARDQQIETKLGWLRPFREPLKEWEALCQSGHHCREFCARAGAMAGL